jgi:hypothetical protein
LAGFLGDEIMRAFESLACGALTKGHTADQFEQEHDLWLVQVLCGHSDGCPRGYGQSGPIFLVVPKLYGQDGLVRHGV